MAENIRTKLVTIEIKCDKRLFGFCPGDIITADPKQIRLEHRIGILKKRGIIEGIYGAPGGYGLVVRPENEDISYIVYYPDGLILLESPFYKFKVGDIVQDIDKKRRAERGIGEIIVMHPSISATEYYRYLVKFKDTFYGCTNASNNFEDEWYPSKHRTRSDYTKAWCREIDLELVSGGAR